MSRAKPDREKPRARFPSPRDEKVSIAVSSCACNRLMKWAPDLRSHLRKATWSIDPSHGPASHTWLLRRWSANVPRSAFRGRVAATTLRSACVAAEAVPRRNSSLGPPSLRHALERDRSEMLQQRRSQSTLPGPVAPSFRFRSEKVWRFATLWSLLSRR